MSSCRFSKKRFFFCFILMKISPNLDSRLDGLKFWRFTWFPASFLLKLNSCTYPFWFSSLFLPRRTRAHVRCLLGWRKKSTSYNHKTTIWVSHECYLNPEIHKILSRAFWVIAILEFSPYAARVDFKGLISK